MVRHFFDIIYSLVTFFNLLDLNENQNMPYNYSDVIDNIYRTETSYNTFILEI